MNVALRPEASSDLVSAAAYFNDVNDGWGDHFLDMIEVDLADLRDEAGIQCNSLWITLQVCQSIPICNLLPCRD